MDAWEALESLWETAIKAKASLTSPQGYGDRQDLLTGIILQAKSTAEGLNAQAEILAEKRSEVRAAMFRQLKTMHSEVESRLATLAETQREGEDPKYKVNREALQEMGRQLAIIRNTMMRSGVR